MPFQRGDKGPCLQTYLKRKNTFTRFESIFKLGVIIFWLTRVGGVIMEKTPSLDAVLFMRAIIFGSGNVITQ